MLKFFSLTMAYLANKLTCCNANALSAILPVILPFLCVNVSAKNTSAPKVMRSVRIISP